MTDVPTARSQPLGRRYTALWTSATISSLGDGIRLAALPLLAITVTHSPVAIALISVSGQLPGLALSLLSGVLADRYDRRTTMWLCDALRCFFAVGLAILAATDAVTIPALCGIAVVMGAGQTMADQASHALLPSLVGTTSLMTANSRLMSARTAVGFFAGPLAGGTLFALAHPTPFAIDAATFMAAGAILIIWVTPIHAGNQPPARKPISTEMAEGLRWVWRRPVLRGLAGLIAAVNVTQAATQSMLPLLAVQCLHMGGRGYGALLAASGAGAGVAGLLGPRLRRTYGPDRLFAVTVLGTIPVFAVLGVTGNAFLAGLMLGVNAFLGIMASVIMASLRQAIVPNHLLGRVNSVMTFVGTGIGLTFGSMAGGTLAANLGIRAPFFASAALIAAACLLVPRIAGTLRTVALG